MAICREESPVPDSFMKALFQGAITDQTVFPYPELPRAQEVALHPLLEGVRRLFATGIDPVKLDADEAIPAEVRRDLAQLGLFGLLIPEEYGGLGLSATAYARVMQEVAGFDASIARLLGAHQALGATGLMEFGTEAQKAAYLPRLARGEVIAAFALTELGAGSDASAIQTRAEPAAGGFRLHGTKAWVTNGEYADLFTVFARTSSPEEGAKPKITAFLVERGPRVRSGLPDRKLGLRASSTTTVTFDQVDLAGTAVLGDVGRGFMVAMEVLNRGRLGLASGCVGVCRRLIRLTTARCTSRKAFGRPIGEFGLIRDRVASMMAETFALESATYLTTGLVDAGATDFSIESAICKVLASETLLRIVDHASLIAGGASYMADEPYDLILRDARANLVVEGTNETLRCFIALSGMQGPGKELAEVERAMREPIKGFGLLSDFALRKARTALGRERLTRAHPSLERAADLFDEQTAALAKNVEKVLRKHGKNIAEMQFAQKRTADLAIDLYSIVAVLSRTTRAIERQGEEGARRELDLTQIFVTAAEKRLKETSASFDDNDDELRKAVATRAYNDGTYPFDVF
jgi:acyl-CoA dehydrogenase family protein 9